MDVYGLKCHAAESIHLERHSLPPLDTGFVLICMRVARMVPVSRVPPHLVVRPVVEYGNYPWVAVLVKGALVG